MNLYQITQDQSSIIELLEENGGEATEEVLNALQITREAFEKKAEGYAHLIIKLDGEVDIIASEIKRLQALKKTKENSVSRLKESLTNAMLVFGEQDDKGIRRYKTPTLSLSTRKSESVSIDDEKAILSRYIITKQAVSNPHTAAALKSGISVDGASLKTNHSVQIR